MTVLSICTVFDSAAQAYNRPVFVPHANLARRSFQDEINRAGDQSNQMHSHPEDFTLFELGLYDDATARFELHPEPRMIARAKDLKDQA